MESKSINMGSKQQRRKLVFQSTNENRLKNVSFLVGTVLISEMITGTPTLHILTFAFQIYVIIQSTLWRNLYHYYELLFWGIMSAFMGLLIYELFNPTWRVAISDLVVVGLTLYLQRAKTVQALNDQEKMAVGIFLVIDLFLCSTFRHFNGAGATVLVLGVSSIGICMIFLLAMAPSSNSNWKNFLSRTETIVKESNQSETHMSWIQIPENPENDMNELPPIELDINKRTGSNLSGKLKKQQTNPKLTRQLSENRYCNVRWCLCKGFKNHPFISTKCECDHSVNEHNLNFRPIESNERKGEDGANAVKDKLVECLVRLTEGGFFMKYGKRGKPHYRRVLLNLSLRRFEWWSHTNEKLIDSSQISDILAVVRGRNTPIFNKVDKKKKSSTNTADMLSFSMIFKKRTLDLEASERRVAEQWTQDIQTLIDNRLSPLISEK